MLRRVDLMFGPLGNESVLGFDPEGMNLFVGPNGSGKSMLLSELNR